MFVKFDPAAGEGQDAALPLGGGQLPGGHQQAHPDGLQEGRVREEDRVPLGAGGEGPGRGRDWRRRGEQRQVKLLKC